MSKAIIDEYVAAEQLALQQAAQWQYIATLLAVEYQLGASDGWLWSKVDRDIGNHYLIVEEKETGALKITIAEAPEQGEPDA